MRINTTNGFPEGRKAMLALEEVINASGLDRRLLDLIRTRASQLNGCAYCLDMHTKDLLAAGEDPARLHLLAAWRDAPGFTPAERAALDLTEAVTDLGEGVSDEVVDGVREHFSDDEIARLIYAIGAINVWNRLNVVGRPPVGHYRPGQFQTVAS